MNSVLALATLAVLAWGHPGTHADAPAQFPLTEPETTWLQKYGKQIDLSYTGPLSFSHLPYARCLEDETQVFDIAILGMPFDTTVSYRPGARFGPFAIRSGSRRQSARGFTIPWGQSPYEQGMKIMDCGDIPVNAYDNAVAIDQMEVGYSTLLSRPSVADSGAKPPRIITLGGDHTIVLPILRALNKRYGHPISVIHFDAHFDTGQVHFHSTRSIGAVTHGSYFSVAQEEGLITNTSIHGGIRQKFGSMEDLKHDASVGFQVIATEDIDDLGLPEIVRRIRQRVGTTPVYLSLDIDVIEPGLAPATGTPEAGGWTVRELKRILRGLAGLNFVGADLVEVAPAYDFADVTGITAADLVHDFLNMLVSDAPPKPRDEL
ncbi:arginase family-domain-containing protein [Roridomyces roridus]|uniref:Arginase family-domain-containing protein n=1 Tax=Roridomyces roridus TaxID=1738132 RepID=A0AAD7FAT5_9AGAR|nr:arginase family-domain-containing protein [Roridomyces roridus]